jgi:hypothetical protein
VTLHGSFDDAEPVGGRGGAHDLRIRERSTQIAVGTLACPACDAPVLPGPGPMHPADAIACPLCPQTGRVRDFLQLGAPTRPARVIVRLVGTTPVVLPRPVPPGERQ